MFFKQFRWFALTHFFGLHQSLINLKIGGAIFGIWGGIAPTPPIATHLVATCRFCQEIYQTI